jgi:hypothetical protein
MHPPRLNRHAMIFPKYGLSSVRVVVIYTPKSVR